MPVVKTKTAKRARRARGKRTSVRRSGARHPASEVRYVMHDDRPTHVILPIDQYERMLEELEARELARVLDDPKTEWIKAEDAALEIAGSWIARARKSAGLTQKQLAARLRVPQSQISRIEKHPERSTIKTMQRIARALGLDVATLMSFATRAQ